MSGSKPKPLRAKRRKVGPADFTKVIADARAKIARAKTDGSMVRLEAVDTILEDAEPYDVLMACAQAFAPAAAGSLIEELPVRHSDNDEPTTKFFERHRWKVLGQNPL
jgi:hypothetical protein